MRIRLLLALLALSLPPGARAADQGPARIEARSASYLVVGVAHDDSLLIHLSRLQDNAPVRDAVLQVALRGASYPTTAQVDGSYLLQAKDLQLPGQSAMEFVISAGGAEERARGTLTVAAPGDNGADDKGTARQLGWWVLNFAVCIGFLLVISRRRKKREDAEDS